MKSNFYLMLVAVVLTMATGCSTMTVYYPSGYTEYYDWKGTVTESWETPIDTIYLYVEYNTTK